MLYHKQNMFFLQAMVSIQDNIWNIRYRARNAIISKAADVTGNGKEYLLSSLVWVGVNRSYNQILGSTNFSYLFSYKKTKMKRIFLFFKFSTIYTRQKNSRTKHSEWQKIINFTFFVTLS